MKKIGLIVFFILITIISLETSIRFLSLFNVLQLTDEIDPNYLTTKWTSSHSQLGLWHLPDTTYTHRHTCFDVKYQFSHLGNRQIPHVENLKNIAFLGDSFTEGYGLSIEDTYSFKLQQKNKFNVYNLAVAGTNPINYLKTLEYFSKQIVFEKAYVFLYLSNDITDMFAIRNRSGFTLKDKRGSFSIEESGYVEKSIFNKNTLFKSATLLIYNNSYTLRAIHNAYMVLNIKKNVDDSVNRYNYKLNHLNGLKFVMNEIQNVIGKENTYFVILPDILDSSHDNLGIVEELVNFNIIDLKNKLNIRNDGLTLGCDFHFNKTSNNLISEIIGKEL